MVGSGATGGGPVVGRRLPAVDFRVVRTAQIVVGRRRRVLRGAGRGRRRTRDGLVPVADRGGAGVVRAACGHRLRRPDLRGPREDRRQSAAGPFRVSAGAQRQGAERHRRASARPKARQTGNGGRVRPGRPQRTAGRPAERHGQVSDIQTGLRGRRDVRSAAQKRHVRLLQKLVQGEQRHQVYHYANNNHSNNIIMTYAMTFALKCLLLLLLRPLSQPFGVGHHGPQFPLLTIIFT